MSTTTTTITSTPTPGTHPRRRLAGARPKHGGKRPNAGRKRSGRKGLVAHRARPSLSPRHPVHVTLRVKRDVPRLRTGRMYRAIRRVLQRYLGRQGFRVCHVSIQGNHLHFLVEALDRRALARGMQSLAICAARALDAALGRTGAVFEYRYHAVQITTPRQARSALAYVLNNWRRHREDLATEAILKWPVDPYSSGVTFTGWAWRPTFELPAEYVPLPVSPPQTDLLARGDRACGRIDPFECPGPVERPGRLW